MTDSSTAPPRPKPRPAAPLPLRQPPGPISFLYGLWRNPIATWSKPSFEELIVESEGVMGRVALVSDPVAISVSDVRTARASEKRDRVVRVPATTGQERESGVKRPLSASNSSRHWPEP